MARFLFVVPPFTGHINPTISIGVDLIDKGHEVAWFGVEKSLTNALPERSQYYLLEELTNDSETNLKVNLILNSLRKVQRTQGPESIKLLYEDVLVPLARCMRPALKKAIDSFSPHVIINDQQAFMGAICAYEEGIPYITSVTAPEAIQEFPGIPKVMEWEASQIIELQKECGVNEDRKINCSDLLTLIFSSYALMGSDDFSDHYKFVGPVIKNRKIVTDFNWGEIDDAANPKVLVTLGTFIDGLKSTFFSEVIDALGNQPVTVIVLADRELFSEWPANFIVTSFIPQIEMLGKVHAVICHGGHNTVCEALWHGLPLIVIPYSVDQYNVASQVIRAGCGLRLKYSRLTASHLRESVWDILQNEKYKAAAGEIRNSFLQAGGTEEAVRLIELVALTKTKACEKHCH